MSKRVFVSSKRELVDTFGTLEGESSCFFGGDDELSGIILCSRLLRMYSLTNI